jgi:hypothetical protein
MLLIFRRTRGIGRAPGTDRDTIELLAQLQASTGADELTVTTSTFDHAARLASYELLAGDELVAPALSPVDPVQVPGQIRHPGRPLQAGDPAEGLRMPRVVHRIGRHRLHAVGRTDVGRVVRRRALQHLQQ